MVFNNKIRLFFISEYLMLNTFYTCIIVYELSQIFACIEIYALSYFTIFGCFCCYSEMH